MAAGLGLALTAVSGIASAGAAYQQGKAQEANHEYNAQLAENQAKQTELEQRENARRGRKNAEEQLATVRARNAAGGSVSNSGAALAVMGDIAGELELGVQDEFRQASIQRNHLVHSARVQRFQGRDAARSGKLLAASSLIGTGTKLSGNFKPSKSSGALLFGF